MPHRVKCFLNIDKDCSTFPFLSESQLSFLYQSEHMFHGDALAPEAILPFVKELFFLKKVPYSTS